MEPAPDAAASPPLAVPSPEPHSPGVRAKMNWIRAGVLGANDGIISVAGLVIGVAAATTDRTAILIAGVAALVAGAVSMALGEYVSVSSQRDTEIALIAKERRELETDPDGELDELTEIYQAKGLTPETARVVALELSAGDVLAAHLEAELGFDLTERTNPWHAAIASAIAFTLGAALPLLAMVLAPDHTQVYVTFVAVIVALTLTGSVSARLGQAHRMRAVVRLLVGGALAMAVTWAIGAAFGATVVG